MAYQKISEIYDYTKIPEESRPTICWTCKRSTGKEGFRDCEWFQKAQPVKGWKANQRFIRKDKVVTYRVLQCPKYIYDDEYEKAQHKLIFRKELIR